MNSLVDAEQSAFLKGRYILGNVAMAEELIFSIHKQRLPWHISKVDFAKTFDHVDWDFLFDLLKVRGFGERWIGWIMCILFSSKVNIMINGHQMATFITREDFDKVIRCHFCCSSWSQTY